MPPSLAWTETGAGAGQEAALCRLFAGRYPGDPALLAPLYLNVLTLEAGDAIFIPAGMPHAYVHGFGVECMANSDNVLRGGLSPKHIDREELFAVLDFEPRAPRILPRLSGHTGHAGYTGYARYAGHTKTSGWERYDAPCREFTLCRLELEQGEGVSAPAVLGAGGAAIVLSAAGDALLTVTGGDGREAETLTLRRGEAAFIPRRAAGVHLTAAAAPAAPAGKTLLFAALAPDEPGPE